MADKPQIASLQKALTVIAEASERIARFAGAMDDKFASVDKYTSRISKSQLSHTTWLEKGVGYAAKLVHRVGHFGPISLAANPPYICAGLAKTRAQKTRRENAGVLP